MASFAKLFSFNRSELSILMEAWFVFLKSDIQISFTQYENWRNDLNSLRQLNKAGTPTNFTLAQIRAIIKLSEIAGRFHFRKMNCLRRCISQQKMLKKRGVDTRMHIGVRYENHQLKAHSWLSFQGQVINDTDDVTVRYSELKTNDERQILRHLK